VSDDSLIGILDVCAANLHMERRSWNDVNQCVIEMLKLEKADPCAMLIKGNLALNSLPPKAKAKKGVDHDLVKKNHLSKVGLMILRSCPLSLSLSLH
jgi:hypothetical protein